MTEFVLDPRSASVLLLFAHVANHCSRLYQSVVANSLIIPCPSEIFFPEMFMIPITSLDDRNHKYQLISKFPSHWHFGAVML